MNKKIKVIIRELGRINTRSSYDYSYGDGESELLDNIAALIAEHQLKNPQRLRYKDFVKIQNTKKLERYEQRQLEIIADNNTKQQQPKPKYKKREKYIKRGLYKNKRQSNRIKK